MLQFIFKSAELTSAVMINMMIFNQLKLDKKKKNLDA